MVLTLLALGDALGIYFAIVLAIPVLIVLVGICCCCYVVEHKTRMVVERCGRFHRVCYPGLNILVPFLDKPRKIRWRTMFPKVAQSRYGRGYQQQPEIQQVETYKIDLRRNVMDFPTQPIITRDNVEIQVHPMILYSLVDPMRVAYETYDLSHAVEKLVQTNLRAIVGDMGMDDTLASREEINRSLKIKIQKICHNWGLEVEAVELLEITPSENVQRAMNMQLIAERERRAAIVTADGDRLQKRLDALGQCEAKKAISKGTQRTKEILAKGQSDARKTIAQAEAKAIQIIGDAVQEYGVSPSQYLIALRYIETFEKVCTFAKSRRVFFPFEADTIGTLGVLGKEE